MQIEKESTKYGRQELLIKALFPFPLHFYSEKLIMITALDLSFAIARIFSSIFAYMKFYEGVDVFEFLKGNLEAKKIEAESVIFSFFLLFLQN